MLIWWMGFLNWNLYYIIILYIYKHLYLIYLTHLILFPIILWLSLLSLILRVKPQNPAASREGPFLPVVIGRERDLANPELFFWTPITSLDIYTCEKARGGSITPVIKLSRTYVHNFFYQRIFIIKQEITEKSHRYFLN